MLLVRGQRRRRNAHRRTQYGAWNNRTLVCRLGVHIGRFDLPHGSHVRTPYAPFLIAIYCTPDRVNLNRPSDAHTIDADPSRCSKYLPISPLRVAAGRENDAPQLPGAARDAAGRKGEGSGRAGYIPHNDRIRGGLFQLLRERHGRSHERRFNQQWRSRQIESAPDGISCNVRRMPPTPKVATSVVQCSFRANHCSREVQGAAGFIFSFVSDRVVRLPLKVRDTLLYKARLVRPRATGAQIQREVDNLIDDLSMKSAENTQVRRVESVPGSLWRRLLLIPRASAEIGISI